MDVDKSPLVFTESNGRPKLVYPAAGDPSHLHFNEGEKMFLFCPGLGSQAKPSNNKDVKPNNSKKHARKEISSPENIVKSVKSVKCLKSNEVQFDSEIVTFKTLSCALKPDQSNSPVLKKIEGRCSRGHRYAIGHELGKDKFLKIMDLCHDELAAETLWSHSVIQPTQSRSSTDVFCQACSQTFKFKSGTLYNGLSMTKEKRSPYAVPIQVASLNRILGNSNGKKYVFKRKGKQMYLSRGHLVARGDKIFKTEREATYFYANTVPMWNTVNEGNWFIIEDYIRILSNEKGHPLHTWTGGFDVMELEDKPIFLGGNNKLPVPKILYKCAVDKKAEESICFLVVNNPYLKEEKFASGANYKKCKELEECNQIFPDHSATKYGRMYCCSLKDFYRKNEKQLGLGEIEKFLEFKTMDLTKSHVVPVKRKQSKEKP
ncbi:hypothetical protein TKK_0018444 [Trichogramma kaykai]